MSLHLVHQLIYASAAVRPFSLEELTYLLAIARRKNSERGLTGMLLYEAGSFLQVLEGDEPVVEQTFAMISKDPRHRGAVVLFRGTAEARAFDEWSMGLVEVSPALRELPGLNDFLRSGVDGLSGTHPTAKKVLEGFREGRYRQFVRA